MQVHHFFKSAIRKLVIALDMRYSKHLPQSSAEHYASQTHQNDTEGSNTPNFLP
jgi:hypothetical protein